MEQRSMLCTSPMIDLQMDQPGQGYPYPEPCILFGGITNFLQSDIQTIVTASRNLSNLDGHHLPEHYDSPMFYGTPQYHGTQHRHHAANLDLGVATASNFYLPHMATPSSGIPVYHGPPDQLPSSGSYGAIGVSADVYGRNSHFRDDVRGPYKIKNAEGITGSFQYFNASASSSSSVTPLNATHPDGVAAMDAASYTMPQYRGNGTPSIREVGSQRSLRNSLRATTMNPLLVHNHNHFIQGNYTGQPFPPSGSLWLDQHFNNCNNGGASAWTQAPAVPYMNGSNITDGSLETRNRSVQQYHETAINRSSTFFLHSSPVNFQHQNFPHQSPPVQGVRNHNISSHPQVAATSYRAPATYASHSTMTASQDGLGLGSRHPGPVPPASLRIYRSHRERVLPETTQRHHNLPHLRVLPTDGVAVLEIPDYHEVGNFIDHHRDMRLDIEDMPYEELLALGERIGSVNTGLSEETITSQLKTRNYLSFATSINLEEAASVDSEPDSCVICQEDYRNQEKIGILDCGHEYHTDCLKNWLLVKNVCPICKSEALAMERKDV